ncbi:CapA family protein [Streptomyces sp. A3M-1-3]|uniref:CapA family protein n=1 Tax=Streptomyces sp. A3M-1-3 TaxID=2962044 RepID=UPI0020B6A538|nr:CapA family protein [Streptomyces sp. A3M-1-3]MCP3818203.1 CapA family protein [Streptomyces sp. A3M-1-3]
MKKRTRLAAMALSVLLLGSTAGCAGSSPAPARLGGSEGPEAPSATEGSRAGPEPSAATRSAPAGGFTLVAGGDVLPHASVIRQAKADAGGEGYDFKPMLAGVRPVVAQADLAICHMETVYGEAGGPFTGYPDFKSPPQIAEALAATGYDSCSTASNHTLDDGAAGLGRTLDTLDRAGIKHAGSARTAAEAGRPAWLTAGSAKVAQLAYTYGTNGYPMPEGQPWAVSLIDEEKIVADARAARREGADVVVVSLHWGTEWQTAPDELQLTLGRSLTASQTGGRCDIDLILGTHAHVPQAYEKVNGTWIVYGMGDQIAGPMINYENRADPRGNQGSIGRFTFAPPAGRGERWQVRKAEFIPQWMDVTAGRVVNLPEVLSRSPGRDDYEKAQQAIRQAVLSRGAAGQGLTMGR